MKAQWVKYDGSDEQIAELRSSKHGWIARVDIVGVGDSIILDENEPIEDIQTISAYLICNPHPNADMIRQWARTGQPVWYKHRFIESTGECGSFHPAFCQPETYEYSFTEFEEEV